MNKIKINLVIVISFISLSLGSDNNVSLIQNVNRINSISFSILDPFDIINPSFQVSYNRKLSNLLFAQIEGGPIIFHSIENLIIDKLRNVKDCPFFNDGYTIRFEIKYSLISSSNVIIRNIGFGKSTIPYISYELSYLTNLSRVQSDFIVGDTSFNYSFGNPSGDQNGYVEDFIVDKTKIGINLKFGIMEYIGRHTYIEPFIGIGISKRNIRHFERENMNDRFYNESIENLLYKPGNSIVINIPINVKIGYSF